MADYRKHTKERFKERFLSNKYSKMTSMDEMSDEEYNKLCEMCRDEDVGDLITKYKKVVNFRGIHIWVAYTKRISKRV